MAKRLGYIDVAKAIAIVMVVVGHYGRWLEILPCGFPPIISNFVYSFHIPLFFVLSGFFAHVDRPYDLRREARSLLVPYVVGCVLLVCATMLDAAYKGEDVIAMGLYWSREALYGAGGAGLHTLFLQGIGGIGALWFLLALFWSRLFANACAKMPHPELWVALLFVGGFTLTQYCWLPFSLFSGMTATAYLWLGVLIRKHGLFEPGRIPAGLWIGIVIIWVCAIRYAGHLGLVTNNYPAGALDAAGAVCGTLCIVRFSQFIADRLHGLSRLLECVGRNSLPIYIMHAIELIVFPAISVQTLIQDATGVSMAWFTIPLHLVVIAAMCGVFYLLPAPVSGLLFPQRLRAAKKEKADA